MNVRWKVFVYAMALFLAGVVTGGFAGLKYARHSFDLPPSKIEIANTMRAHLSGRVGLNAEQLRQIDPIIEQTAAHLEAIRLETTRTIGNVFADFHSRIADPGHLTDAQKATLTQIEKEHAGNRQPTALRAAATP